MTVSLVIPSTDVSAPPVQPASLRTSDTPLGRARLARGWSQQKVVRALVLLADSWGWAIATEPSLKVQVSRWENGVVRPGPTYQVLLCALFRATPDELGFTRATQAATLADRVASLEAALDRLTSQLGEVAA
ncbi:helix-turn-helix domain-containing protein [Streptomyces tirandamycinicus]|uniref:helix-turn-helix domain-containing protein n=1 Tax=Streptomyces tirandamycinicus TaxID=2174846 RepID=UPI002271D6A8|nr:helix-turn-helix transcriptional regulator [Streptomyces tirandamycinicus]MCY0981425.1 helix-turn-helix transcriptional regulator [Streptomyces tirandamycinicus]